MDVDAKKDWFFKKAEEAHAKDGDAPKEAAEKQTYLQKCQERYLNEDAALKKANEQTYFGKC